MAVLNAPIAYLPVFKKSLILKKQIVLLLQIGRRVSDFAIWTIKQITGEQKTNKDMRNLNLILMLNVFFMDLIRANLFGVCFINCIARVWK